MPAVLRAFEAASVSDPRQKWRVEFDAEGASFVPAGDERERLRIYRADFARALEVASILGSSVLTVRHPVRKFQLKLERAGRDILDREIGALGREHLAAALRRRYQLALPIAALFLLTSLPMDSAGLPFDPLGLSMAVVLGALWIWSRVRPHPVVFLLDATWFLALGATWLWPRAGERGWFSWLMVAVSIGLAAAGVGEYRKYGRVSGATRVQGEE